MSATALSVSHKAALHCRGRRACLCPKPFTPPGHSWALEEEAQGLSSKGDGDSAPCLLGHRHGAAVGGEGALGEHGGSKA